MSYHITFTTNQKEKKLNQNPVIILDLTEEELKYYFRNKRGCLGGENLKYQTFNDKIINNSSFYFSEELTRYYKETFEEFRQKFPLIKAKLPINNTKLKSTMKIIKNFNENNYVKRKLNCFEKNQQKALIKSRSCLNNFKVKTQDNLFFKTALQKFTKQTYNYEKPKKRNILFNRPESPRLPRESSSEYGLKLRTYDENDEMLKIFGNAPIRLEEMYGYQFEEYGNENYPTYDYNPRNSIYSYKNDSKTSHSLSKSIIDGDILNNQKTRNEKLYTYQKPIFQIGLRTTQKTLNDSRLTKISIKEIN